MRFITLISLLGLLLSPVAQAQVTTTTHEYRLKNGLKIIVREDHRAPIVVSQLWYKVGSAYEPGGITGISHVLEHMMFKGTPKYPAGEFSKIVAKNGGMENAFTAQDFTGYFEKLAADRLKLSFELEADRMSNLTLPEAEFRKEVEVVKEERRMRIEDNPQSLTYERFAAAAHINSPYHHPIIGWMDDLNNMQIADLRHWYQAWYAPNNAVLVVVGDVKPQQVLTLAKKYFGAIPSAKIPVLKPQKAPPPLGQRHVIVNAPAKLPHLYIGYNTPTLKTAQNQWEPYALEVLAAILDGGSSARIEKNIVRGKQVASSASAGYDIYSRFDSLFLFSGTPTPSHTIEDLKQAFFAEVKKLQTELVSQQDLDKVKTLVIANKVYSKDSPFGQAIEIGMLETIGLSWRDGEEFATRVQAITPEQIQTVAKRYLTPRRLTVGILKPKAIKSNKGAA